MTERGRAALQPGADRLAIGPSALAFDGTTLTININEIAVPWPSHVRGTVRVNFETMTASRFNLDAEGRHRWWPIAPCARIEVALERPALRWSGHAYLDTNSGDAPLEESFGAWHWSRASGNAGTTILYDVVPRGGASRNLSLRIARDGTASDVENLMPMSLPPTFWRVPRATRADAGASVTVLQTLEDAPFYARSLLSTHIGGAAVTAVHESLSLTRFDTRWVQMMLPFRMPRRIM